MLSEYFKHSNQIDKHNHERQSYTRVLCVNPPTSILKLERVPTSTKDGRETATDYEEPTQLDSAPFVPIGLVIQALSLSAIAMLLTKPQKLLKREMNTGTLCSSVIQLFYFLYMFYLQ